jgi:myo-inositol-1(or 4)-monophosphatase
MQVLDSPPGVTIKENQNSIVTKADIASEKTIIDILSRDFPNHNIISEERGFIENGSEFTWVIDPLDGTSNFAAGIPWFGVLIALFEGTSPTLAGAYLPVLQDLYIATAGMGSLKNGKKIHTTPNTNLKETLVTFSTDYSDDEDMIRKELIILKRLIAGSRNLRNTNSLVYMLYMAEGKLGGLREYVHTDLGYCCSLPYNKRSRWIYDQPGGR